MLSDAQESRLVELIDREMIRDCLHRYQIGCDRADGEMLAAAFWPDARIRIGDFDGTGDGFVEWVVPRLRSIPRTHHNLGSPMIRVSGTTAKAETYSQNWHTVRTFAGRLHDVIHGGRYLDRFEKRADEWRIVDRMVMVDWILERANTVDPTTSVPGLLGCDSNPMGDWYPDDALYTFLGAMSPAEETFAGPA